MVNLSLDQPETQSDRECRRDEEEIARRIEKGINEAKRALSEKLDDNRAAAERLLKHGRYALEDSFGEVSHAVKRHPLGFLGIAFALGAVFGLLLSHSSKDAESGG